MSDSVIGEPGFSCDVCGELFKSPVEAQAHSKTAHGESRQT